MTRKKIETIRLAIGKTHELITLETKKIETLHQLVRALCVEMLVPDVRKRGKVSTSLTNCGTSMFDPWRDERFRVRCEIGGDEEFKLTEIPVPLWPEKMLESYQRNARGLEVIAKSVKKWGVEYV